MKRDLITDYLALLGNECNKSDNARPCKYGAKISGLAKTSERCSSWLESHQDQLNEFCCDLPYNISEKLPYCQDNWEHMKSLNPEQARLKYEMHKHQYELMVANGQIHLIELLIEVEEARAKFYKQLHTTQASYHGSYK